VRERDAKQDEITILTDQSINDLWRTDLDTFLAQWDVSWFFFFFFGVKKATCLRMFEIRILKGR
jgi:hypothetical protein